MEKLKKEPLSYRAKAKCCDETHTMEVDEGDTISLEEYSSMAHYLKGNFEPIFDEDEDADQVLGDFFGLLEK